MKIESDLFEVELDFSPEIHVSIIEIHLLELVYTHVGLYISGRLVLFNNLYEI